jgi:hypothetical protein
MGIRAGGIDEGADSENLGSVWDPLGHKANGHWLVENYLWLGWAYLNKKVHRPWHQGVCLNLPMIFCA